MHRPRLGSVLCAAALALAAVIPLTASPAAAANACDAGQFPSTFAAQSGLKVRCTTDAGTNVNHLEIHDAENVMWHHGAAHVVLLAPAAPNKATTINSKTIKFTAGKIQTRDIRRPIVGFDAAKVSPFRGGTFIVAVAPVNCTTTCTSATLSQAASKTEASISVRVENTTNRVLNDAVCAAGTSTLTSATAKFVAGDVNKSVSGGPFASGTFITAVNSATTITMNQPHTAACIAARLTTIGAATYAAGVPKLITTDPMMMNLSNTTGGGQGFTCAAGTARNLVLTALAKNDMGGFNAQYVGLSVVIKIGTVTKLSTVIAAYVSPTTVKLAANCPAGITATAGIAQIGQLSAGGPPNNAPMMTLAAGLNLNPALVASQDNCNLNTFEGFEVVGGWVSPGAFAANASTPRVAVGQVVFPTSVISFNGFVVPKALGDTADSTPHYNFSFPILPTSLAVCLSAGLPTNPTALAFGMNPTTMSVAPFLPTGSGNPGDATIRTLLPMTGSFSQTIDLITNPSTVVSSSTSTACTIGADTSAPSFTCGDG